MKLIELFKSESQWIPGFDPYSKDINGNNVSFNSPKAVSYSIYSGINKCYHTNELRTAIKLKIRRYLERKYPGELIKGIDAFGLIETYSDLMVMVRTLAI